MSPSTEFEGAEVMPFWSERAFAKQCAIEEWANYFLASIALDEFINAWIPGLNDDNLLIGTDWNTNLIGKEIEPMELLKKLSE